MNGSIEKSKQMAAPKTKPVVSLRARDGAVVEMVLKPEAGEASLVVCRDGQVSEERSVLVDGREHVPYSTENNLLTHRVILLPSGAEEYGTDGELVAEVQEFIHRYVDVSAGFEEVCAHYVLMSWGYDTFSELPYLRVRGEYGCGKSRFLLTIGSLCYKPIFASGASTVSPLFRLIDEIGGTLVVDEADFWASDERAEIVKILNNGNAKGFPVLRSEVTPSKEFSPRAFNIYGPKLIATRHPFDDVALESRCLTEVLGRKALRRGIPISLPRRFEAEAQALRNKLLMYRLRRFGHLSETQLPAEPGLEPRRAQILAPLLSVAVGAEARARLRSFVDNHSGSTKDRDFEAARNVLFCVKALLADSVQAVSVKAIAKRFDEEWGEQYGAEVANRWVGTVLRRLGIELHKSNGVYVVSLAQFPRLHELCAEYRVGDIGDDGDMERAVEEAA